MSEATVPADVQALRYFVLLVGIMNLFYVVWDYIDDRLFDKRNTSDCAQFSELLGWPTSGEYIGADTILMTAWFLFWLTYDGLVFAAAILAGIIVFRVSETCDLCIELSADGRAADRRSDVPRSASSCVT